MLVGRNAQLELIAEAVQAAGQCAAPVQLLYGEAGIGKSSVLDAAAARAAAAGYLVVRAHGDELDRARPFAPLLDGLRAAGIGPGDHSDPGDPGDPAGTADGPAGAGTDGAPARSSPFETGPERRALQCDAIVARIEAHCETQPVAVFVDDLQWVDAATLLTLSVLGRRTGERPLLLWLASRLAGSGDDDLHRFIETMARAGQRNRLVWQVQELPPLDADAAGRLAARTAGAPLGPRLAELVERCAGNPLLVTELVGALRDNGDIVLERAPIAELAPGAGGIELASLPDAFHATVLARMAQLGDADRQVATVASALGAQFTLLEVAAVVERPVAELLPVVRRLVELRFLVDTDVRLQFRHDLVRGAVHRALSPSLQAALHRSIADALLGLGAPLSRVAEHLALGAVPGAADAVQLLRRAAAEIAHRDPVACARLLRRAIELCPPHEVERDLLLGELVEALSWSGETNEAVAVGSALLARPIPTELERSVRAALGRALLLLGRPTDAVDHERRLVELSSVNGGASAWPHALCAVCRIFAMDLDGALEDAALAVAAGDAEGDAAGEILGRCVQAFGLNALGESERAVGLATEAVLRADATPGGQGHRLHPHLFRAITLLTLGRVDEALAGIAQGRLLGASIGAHWAMGTYHFVTALAHWDRAAWDDLLAEVEAGFDVSDEQGTAIAQVWALAVVGRVQLFRGQQAEAAATLDRADAVLAGDGVQVGVDWLLHSRALLLEDLGRTGEALELLRFAWHAATDLQARASLLVFGIDLARLALAAGDQAFAEEVATALTAIAGSAAASGTDRLSEARAALARALVAGDGERVVEVADALEAMGRPFETAQARAQAAALLAGDRRQDAGRQAALALACFEALDAEQQVAALRPVLAATTPRTPVRRVGRAVSGWESLTASEREVVDEVSAGRSNPEIAHRLGISRRTVEAHLRSVFTKLSVTNRTALALAAVQRAHAEP
ncbi:MAG: AAA family ATPase [Acidimicrobiia bacterium]